MPASKSPRKSDSKSDFTPALKALLDNLPDPDETAGPVDISTSSSLPQSIQMIASPVVCKTTFTVHWNGQRCYLGNTVHLRCLLALAGSPGSPVSNQAILDHIGIGESFITTENGVRIAIYRLKKKLRRAGMAAVANGIRNVRGAYIVTWP